MPFWIFFFFLFFPRKQVLTFDANCLLWKKSQLLLKCQSQVEQTIIWNICLYYFVRENKAWNFMWTVCLRMPSETILHCTLTLVLLNPNIHCLCKHCRSRSVGFWRSQLIWICTVCHWVCEFIATIWIKQSDWLKIRSGCGILIYSAGQGLRLNPKVFNPIIKKLTWMFS